MDQRSIDEYIISEEQGLSYRDAVNNLFSHSKSLDLAIIDTCVTQPYTNNSWKDRIEYSKCFNIYVLENSNVKTIDSVLKNEIIFDKETGYGIKGKEKLIQQTKNTNKNLSKNYLKFDEKQLKNYNLILDSLKFLQEGSYLLDGKKNMAKMISDIDYEILCSTLNAGAFYDNVGLFTNDLNLIRRLVRFQKNLLGTFENKFKLPINKIKAYTFLPTYKFKSNNIPDQERHKINKDSISPEVRYLISRNSEEVYFPGIRGPLPIKEIPKRFKKRNKIIYYKNKRLKKNSYMRKK